MGAAIQAEALAKYEFPSSTQCVFVKSRTFAELATLAGHMFGDSFVVKWGVQIAGWNMCTAEHSNKLVYPELILQTGRRGNVIHDAVIPRECSLAVHALRMPTKEITLIEEFHNDGIYDHKPHVDTIERFFSQAPLPKHLCPRASQDRDNWATLGVVIFSFFVFLLLVEGGRRNFH